MPHEPFPVNLPLPEYTDHRPRPIKNRAPFSAVLRPSRWGLGLAVGAVLAAGLALQQLPSPMALAGLPLVLWAGWRSGQQCGWGIPQPRWLAPAAPLRLAVTAQAELVLGWASHEEIAQVWPDSYVSPWLIVLRLDAVSGRHDVVLLPDSVPADFHRQLRVYLRWHCRPLFAQVAHAASLPHETPF